MQTKCILILKKLELAIFKSKQKECDGKIKLNLNCKRLSPTDNVKYLGVKSDGVFLWKSYIDHLSVK